MDEWFLLVFATCLSVVVYNFHKLSCGCLLQVFLYLEAFSFSAYHLVQTFGMFHSLVPMFPHKYSISVVLFFSCSPNLPLYQMIKAWQKSLIWQLCMQMRWRCQGAVFSLCFDSPPVFLFMVTCSWCYAILSQTMLTIFFVSGYSTNDNLQKKDDMTAHVFFPLLKWKFSLWLRNWFCRKKNIMAAFVSCNFFS